MKKKLAIVGVMLMLLIIVFSGCFENKKEIGFIQNLINNASEGDTINIPSGTYYENIVIDKTINLIGEDKNTTIIDGSGDVNVLYITADHVTISGFTIQNSGEGIFFNYSNNNVISGNIISHNGDGIRFYYSSNNTIYDNTITKDAYGIHILDYSNKNTIYENTIINNSYDSMAFLHSSNNIISDNTITNNFRGISLVYSNNNTIYENTIINNSFEGIYCIYSSNNIIYHNNLINNTPNADETGNNTWYDTISESGNYWSDYKEKYPNAVQVNNYLVGLLWDTPYNITRGNNQDKYPLMNPIDI